MSAPLPDDVVQTFLARCRREDAEAGLPAHIEDPAVLDAIATVVLDANIDYVAEMRRIRLAQGLDPEIPKHVRDAVAALLTNETTSTGASE